MTVRRTAKKTAKKAPAKKTAIVHGKRVNLSGPFKGSDANGGREHYTWYDPKTGKRGSVNAARIEHQKSTGREVPKGKDVDHKDGNKHNTRKGNLQTMSHGKNVAKGNRERTRKKK